GQAVPRVRLPGVGDVAVADAVVPHLVEGLLHLRGRAGLAQQGGEAGHRVAVGPPGAAVAAETLGHLDHAHDVRGRPGDVLLRAARARVRHYQGQAALLPRVLVEGRVIIDPAGRAGLLVEEDALDGRVEADPAVHVGLHLREGAVGVLGAHVADDGHALL